MQKLPHDLPNDLGLKILDNQKILRKSLESWEFWAVEHFSVVISVFCVLCEFETGNLQFYFNTLIFSLPCNNRKRSPRGDLLD